MFRKRNTQKPPEGFYVDFKKNYTYLGQSPEAPVTPAQSLTNSLGMSLPPSQFDHFDGVNDFNLDNNTIDWNQQGYPGYGENDMYEHQIPWGPPTPHGLLQTQHDGNDAFAYAHSNNYAMSTGLQTPLTRSLPNSAFPQAPSGSLTMNDIHPSRQYQPGLSGDHYDQDLYQNRHYAPEVLQQSYDPRMIPHHQASVPHQSVYAIQPINATVVDASSKFRFRVVLQTGTAMFPTNEDPLTYLNKSAVYKINIKDTRPQQITSGVRRYRTYVRISFDEEHQREKPSHYWQLWAEGRGSSESHQRGGRLQAVEFVPHGQPGQPAPISRPNYELLSQTLDGFSVAWQSNNTETVECEVQVRFNFLSTDFSRAKGVKGIPVRFCAKTEVLDNNFAPSGFDQETCYCKVKLFRDHGAERKISNDKQHVKKSIEKLNQQLVEAQTKTTKEGGKRRRSDSMSGSARPNKAAKHKRHESVSSASSIVCKEEDDTTAKLAIFESMLGSERSESVLYLCGQAQDDPDLFPVDFSSIPDEPPASASVDSPEIGRLSRHSTQLTSTSVGSPAISITSPTSPPRPSKPLQCPTPVDPTPPKSGGSSVPFIAPPLPRGESSRSQHQLATPLDGATKVERAGMEEEMDPSRWLEAVGVDQTYKAPAQKAKPAACFYILPTVNGTRSADLSYLAIYLRRRTLKDFVEAVARKCNVDVELITETVHINARGLSIRVDDEIVMEMNEGQDMQVDLSMKMKPENVEEGTSEVKPATDYKLALRY